MLIGWILTAVAVLYLSIEFLSLEASRRARQAAELHSSLPFKEGAVPRALMSLVA